MRETLSLLYDDFCLVKTCSKDGRENDVPCYLCQPLIDVLGVLSHSQVEVISLNCLLERYLSFTTLQWIQRPLSDQKEALSEACGMHLIKSLPPVPLALLFVTILLEQKVCLFLSLLLRDVIENELTYCDFYCFTGHFFVI